MVIILIGPPGSGKGTQGRILSEKIHLPYFSSGDFLREMAKKDTPFSRQLKMYMDKGELIPDALMNELLLGEISNIITSYGGIIIDGYPRTIDQAKKLDALLLDLNLPDGLIYVIELTVKKNELSRRLRERVFCPSCLRVFQDFETICPFCREKLIRRTDNNIKVIEERLKEYEVKTKNLHEYFFSRGMLLTIPGEGSVNDVATSIEKAIKEKSIDIH